MTIILNEHDSHVLSILLKYMFLFYMSVLEIKHGDGSFRLFMCATHSLKSYQRRQENF